MAATIDTGNVANSGNVGTGGSFNVTCGGSDNFLIVIECSVGSFGNQVAPSAISYNSVAMTLFEAYDPSVPVDGFETSIWYMATPPTGSAHAVAVTTTANTAYCTAIPMSGVNTSSPFGTFTGANGQVNNVVAVTATGGTSSDVYIASALNGVQTITAAGTGQVNLFNVSSVFGNNSLSMDYIPGADAGAFSWTNSGTVNYEGWIALAVAVKGSVAAGIPIAWVT